MTETVKLTIDGNEVVVPKGTSIIQAAEKVGITIPRFCWHPGLSVAGVCRFCMVKVEGMPKLQISCNTVCTEGMKVVVDEAEVKEAHKWALEFHLINHPLDCPICDQAGECELQRSYMKYGKYTSQMEEEKVLKPKALDVGKNLVLDTERCILCSRCVRFENEVTKTDSLGIFNRGDRSVIGTFPNKTIDHNYSYNLVDLCPVGAFTAKDFRFKCRVWFLKELKSICPGCSTGCNVNVFYKKKDSTYYRLKPRENENVNGHWMCDYGRTMYHHLNADQRFALPLKNGAETSWDIFKAEFMPSLRQAKKLRVVFTPQYTNEEYESVLASLSQLFGADAFSSNKIQVSVWRDSAEKRDDFDGILFRGDKNPNTQGLENALKQWNIVPQEFGASTNTDTVDMTLLFAPEVQSSYTNFASDMSSGGLTTKSTLTICFTVNKFAGCEQFGYTVPMLAFVEKSGHFTNFKGIVQELTQNPPVFSGLLNMIEIFRGAHDLH